MAETKQLKEVFTYGGLLSNAHIFVHTPQTELGSDLLTKMYSNLYNVMVNETMIKKDQGLIAFAIPPLTTIVGAAYITHKTFSRHKFEPGTLKTALIRVLKADRSKDTFGAMMFISADHDGKEPSVFLLYKVPMNEMGDVCKAFKEIGESMQTVTVSVQEYTSIKKIPYLGV
ncbi:MAG: hypothetical protein KGL39_01175 [Patescibacteria group bacterium]|nr:hypothetical protein [Patescibacteria group bacterium]